MKVHVVTAVHNRYEITERFVDHLLEQTLQPIHLILVNDGSTDGTEDMVKKKMPAATILHGDGNLWWAGALQKAFIWLKRNGEDGDVVMISNDDIIFSQNYIATGVSLVRDTRLAVGSGYGLKSGELGDGLFQHSFIDGTGYLLKPGSEGNCASSRSLFLTVAQWKKIGGMHPVLLPQYFSDFEFTIRAHRRGFKLQSFEQLKYQYDEGATGYHSYEGLTAKKIFSKRSGMNPIYRLNFILLTTPLRYLPSHLWHQLRRYAGKIKLIKKRK